MQRYQIFCLTENRTCKNFLQVQAEGNRSVKRNITVQAMLLQCNFCTFGAFRIVMTRTFIFLFIAGLFLAAASCIDPGCIDNTEAYLKASFYSYETKSVAAPDSMTLCGVGASVKIYDNLRITPPAFIPLKDSDSKTQFVIELNGITDTITFFHANSLHFVSKECGYSMFHTIDSIRYTHNEIDSIASINPNITLNNADNVAIFY